MRSVGCRRCRLRSRRPPEETPPSFGRRSAPFLFVRLWLMRRPASRPRRRGVLARVARRRRVPPVPPPPFGLRPPFAPLRSAARGLCVPSPLGAGGAVAPWSVGRRFAPPAFGSIARSFATRPRRGSVAVAAVSLPAPRVPLPAAPFLLPPCSPAAAAPLPPARPRLRRGSLLGRLRRPASLPPKVARRAPRLHGSVQHHLSQYNTYSTYLSQVFQSAFSLQNAKVSQPSETKS